MQSNVTAIERAFELAKSGKCESVGKIRTQLRAEGYYSHAITDRQLHDQLKALIDAAKTR